MRHFIIVKWKDPAKMRSEIPAIEALFYELTELSGIHSVRVLPCCIERPNRYDLMIEIAMDEEALPAYDASWPHHEWKDRYGEAIRDKVIFDADN